MRELPFLILGIGAVCPGDDNYQHDQEFKDSFCYQYSNGDDLKWSPFTECDTTEHCGGSGFEWSTGIDEQTGEAYHCPRACTVLCGHPHDNSFNYEDGVDLQCDVGHLLEFFYGSSEGFIHEPSDESDNYLRLSCDPSNQLCHAYCAHKRKQDDGEWINEWLDYIPSGKVLYTGPPIQDGDDFIGIHWGGRKGSQGGQYAATWDGTFKVYGLEKIDFFENFSQI